MMDEQVICLEASYADNQLKIGIQQPDEMVWHYDTLNVSIADIEYHIQSFTENINKMVKSSGQDSFVYDKIKTLGQQLCDTLFTSAMKTFFRNCQTDYLLLKLDDVLVSIPWELICIDNKLLCERFCMGRTVKTHQSVAHIRSRNILPPLNMWILSENDDQLSGVNQETNDLLAQLDQINDQQIIVNAELDQGGRVDHVKSHIRNFDMIHFAGHADYDKDHPEKSGWRIGNEHLTAIDIDRMSGSSSMPSLIFSNACQSARTQQWAHEAMSFDLANAFMRAGVKHYLGTFWEIPDQASTIFSQIFYQELFSGKTIGKAMKLAREKCMKSYHSPIGAAYVLYGDPKLVYFSTNNNSDPIQTRGTKFRPLNAIKQKIQAMPFNILWFLLCVVILLSSLWVGQNVIALFSRDQEIAFQSIIKKRAIEKQAYIDRLFAEIEALTPYKSQFSQDHPDDDWTSTQLTISIDYETYFTGFDQSQLSLIAAVVGKALIDSRKVVVLERVHLDKILLELKRANSKLIAQNNRLLPKLLSAKLIVFIELHQENNQQTVLMHLANIQQGHVVDYFFHSLENERILQQKDKLSTQILQSITQHYPLRGKIADVKGQRVHLNIGADEGVRSGMVFDVLKNNCKLSVDIIDSHHTIASISEPNIKLERGWKVEISH